MITIKWKDNAAWVDFDVKDIIGKPRNHCIDLFDSEIPVVAKQGGMFFTNDKLVADKYRKEGKSIRMFSQLERDERLLSEVGLA